MVIRIVRMVIRIVRMVIRMVRMVKGCSLDSQDSRKNSWNFNEKGNLVGQEELSDPHKGQHGHQDG